MNNHKYLIHVLLITLLAGYFSFIPRPAHAGFVYRVPSTLGLASGLVGLWSFNGADMSGTTAYDRSGNANNGTLTNGPVRTIGKLGQALEFDGSDDDVSASYIDAMNSGNNISIAAWINPSANSASLPSVVSEWTSSSGPLLFLESNGTKLSFQMGNLAEGRATTDANTITTGTWSHVVAVYNGTQLLIYINGVLSKTADTTDNNADNSALFVIAKSASGAGLDFFTGGIDEVRAYNRALSAAEVARLYSMGR